MRSLTQKCITTVTDQKKKKLKKKQCNCGRQEKPKTSSWKKGCFTPSCGATLGNKMLLVTPEIAYLIKFPLTMVPKCRHNVRLFYS